MHAVAGEAHGARQRGFLRLLEQLRREQPPKAEARRLLDAL